jgi:hypothetical protein
MVSDVLQPFELGLQNGQETKNKRNKNSFANIKTDSLIQKYARQQDFKNSDFFSRVLLTYISADFRDLDDIKGNFEDDFKSYNKLVQIS